MKLKRLIEWGDSNVRPPAPEDVAQLLKATRDGDVPLYLSNRPYFLFSVLVPNELLTGNFADDVAEWNTSAPSGFGWGLRWSEAGEVPYLSEPLDRTSSEILDQGMAPLFVRYFEGRDSYIEPNQRLTHVLELHREGVASDWCRVNELGELVPTLRVAETEQLSICTIDREALNRFLVAADMSLVRLFVVNATNNSDLFRARDPENREWSSQPDEIFLRTTYVKSELVLVRGFDVVRVPASERDQVLRALQGTSHASTRRSSSTTSETSARSSGPANQRRSGTTSSSRSCRSAPRPHSSSRRCSRSTAPTRTGSTSFRTAWSASVLGRFPTTSTMKGWFTPTSVISRFSLTLTS